MFMMDHGPLSEGIFHMAPWDATYDCSSYTSIYPSILEVELANRASSCVVGTA